MRGVSFRSALAVSASVHVLLVFGVGLILRLHANHAHSEKPPATIDTRADVRLELVSDEASPPVEVTPPHEVVADAPAAGSLDSPPKDPDPPLVEVEGPPRANAIAIHHPLPPELLALLKKPSQASTPGPVQPAEGKTPAKPGPAWAAAGSPVHGALKPKQCIVYVLDASGSMGEWGKFDAERGSLIATLRLQPESVRFQVVIYSGTASIPLRGSAGECLPATAENIARMIEALQALDAPAGRSNHVEGLRTALTFRPDLVLIFTDADDLPATPIRGIVRQAARPATICVAKVGEKGVGRPSEVK